MSKQCQQELIKSALNFAIIGSNYYTTTKTTKQPVMIQVRMHRALYCTCVLILTEYNNFQSKIFDSPNFGGSLIYTPLQ